MEDIESRRVWRLSTGRLLDECRVNDVPDRVLNRRLEEVDDIRVELTLKNAVEMFERKGPDVVEIFSQPRLCQELGGRTLAGIHLRPGYSLDMTTNDPLTGQPRDLSRPEVQSRVKKLIRDTQPFCVIGPPPCTAFSPLQEISRAKRNPKDMRRQPEEAKGHIRFCMDIYKMQMKGHRHFVHEHPVKSKAWDMPEVVELLMMPEVGSTTLHMCAFGMTSVDEHGEAPV